MRKRRDWSESEYNNAGSAGGYRSENGNQKWNVAGTSKGKRLVSICCPSLLLLPMRRGKAPSASTTPHSTPSSDLCHTVVSIERKVVIVIKVTKAMWHVVRSSELRGIWIGVRGRSHHIKSCFICTVSPTLEPQQHGSQQCNSDYGGSNRNASNGPGGYAVSRSHEIGVRSSR